MHPDILRQLAADHIRELITEAGEARRAHEARHAQRRRLPAHLRRSTRLAAQRPGLLEVGRGRAIRVAGTPERTEVIQRMGELIDLGRRNGYRRDELVALLESFPD